ncbi:hypothetical protein K0M31_014354 [Melipona bicolor]|uniref:Uncharacterized protein n=1 Tax=Melipona bicolor TaxID=60889 RepID=A0AA40KU99_9HYME|nr:hypothetical protein K0M31_014354 [Melipona bicolor]
MEVLNFFKGTNISNLLNPTVVADLNVSQKPLQSSVAISMNFVSANVQNFPNFPPQEGVDVSRLSIALVLPRTRLFSGAQCRNEAQRAHVRRVRPIPKRRLDARLEKTSLSRGAWRYRGQRAKGGRKGGQPSRNCTFERNECDGRGGHGALARYHSTVVTGERRQVSVTRKTSVHALTTSYVLTYDVRGSPRCEQVQQQVPGKIWVVAFG